MTSVSPIHEILIRGDETEGLKALKDVRELYWPLCALQSHHLQNIFCHTPFLSYLWLHDNHINDVTFLKQCHHLKELYLQNNSIISLDGCVKHLHSLETFYIQNNKLQHLKETIQEMASMHCIRILNLSLNPLTLEKQYRLFTISHLPNTLLALDQQTVQAEERTQAESLRHPNREHINERIVFGQSYRPSSSLQSQKQLKSASTSNLQHPRRSQSAGHRRKVTYGNAKEVDQHAIECPKLFTVNNVAAAITKKKSLFQFTIFDWSKVPRHRYHPAEETFLSALHEMKPEIRTVKMKM